MAGLTDAQLREVFEIFDANGDGSVDNEELGLVLEALGFGRVEEDTLRSMIAEVDVDFSGKLEFDEFKMMVQKHSCKRDSQEEIANAFAAFAGTNEDGSPSEFISLQDLNNVADEIGAKHISTARFQDLLNSAPGQPIGRDENGDSTGMTIIQWRQIMKEVTQRKYGNAFQLKESS